MGTAARMTHVMAAATNTFKEPPSTAPPPQLAVPTSTAPQPPPPPRPPSPPPLSTTPPPPPTSSPPPWPLPTPPPSPTQPPPTSHSDHPRHRNHHPDPSETSQDCSDRWQRGAHPMAIVLPTEVLLQLITLALVYRKASFPILSCPPCPCPHSPTASVCQQEAREAELKKNWAYQPLYQNSCAQHQYRIQGHACKAYWDLQFAPYEADWTALSCRYMLRSFSLS
jgi:outer membrane biosynthesis protein TonB